MQLGNSVPGLEDEGVFFVENDMYEIARRVKDYDSDAALVCHKPYDMRLGVARFVRDEKWAPGGAWVIAFWCNDQETGDPICDVPDARVIGLMEKFDSRTRQNQENSAKWARRVIMMREYRRLRELRDRAGQTAEESVHGWRQARGVKTKIFVPQAAVGV